MELSKLKSLLGIDASDATKNLALQFVMDDVIETIKNYCHVDTVPIGLTNTAYRMAVDLYRFENPGQESALGSIASIEEGDTKTSFNKSVDDNFKDTLLKNYTRQLNAYRKLRW